MSKMHELLAVESDVQGQYRIIVNETINLFNKEHIFKGFVKKLKMFDEDQAHLNTSEHSEIGTTVPARLDYNSSFIVKYLDVVLQKESTNQLAVADIIVDGIVLAEKVPATFLLGLENKLKEIRNIYMAIPTLDVSVKWEEATDIGKNIYRQVHPETAVKTKKMFQHQILVEPTQFHPAQVEKWEEQIPVGTFTKENWCSMITSTRKAQLLERIDKLSNAIKKARQRANNTEVIKVNIGEKLMNFINAE